MHGCELAFVWNKVNREMSWYTGIRGLSQRLGHGDRLNPGDARGGIQNPVIGGCPYGLRLDGFSLCYAPYKFFFYT